MTAAYRDRPNQREVTGPVKRLPVGVMRTHHCQHCGEAWLEEHSCGRPPLCCPACDPPAAARRAYQRGIKRRRDAEITSLERQVAGLQALLKFEAEGGERANSCGDPGRDSLARAVGRLAHVSGVQPTIEALLTVSAIARAWAAHLASQQPARSNVGPRG